MFKTLYLIILLSLASCIYSINQMNIIQTMIGEFNGSEYGFNMATIDFNADGYDDLVVASSAWNPNGVYNEQQLFGKLYFYWGGPNFDNVPDMVIQGTHYLDYYGKSLLNAGDINGDGYDDLVIGNKDSQYTSTVEIFYGRTIPQPIPDIILSFPLSLTGYITVYPLGDINNDGRADLGFYFSEELNRYGRRLMILTDIFAQPICFRESIINSDFSTITGVGDVNNDGVNDFFMNQSMVGTTHTRMVLFFGDTAFPVIDSLVIVNDTQAVSTRWGCPVGDVNGDNKDDFVAYYHHLWLGNENICQTWNVLLSSDYGSGENQYQFPYQYGDLNNDGYDDIVSSNDDYAMDTGVVNIWLGRSNMNGTVDLYLWDPIETEICHFGYAKAIGDFNADGCDDIAISAPWWGANYHSRPGKVCVFAGNTQLQDTTVANEDETVPVNETSLWDINVYPNPIKNKNIPLNIEFVGNGYKQAHDIEAKIYNLKGQLLQTIKVNSTALKSSSWSGTLKETTSGVYLVSLYVKENKLITKKITMIN